MEEGNAKKIEAIEGLRGATVLMIVLYHITYRFTTLYTESAVQGWQLFISMCGKIGVSIFLIISAYFLYSDKQNKVFKLLKFYKKKFLRLWPLYFISISLTYIVLRLINLPDRTFDFKTYLYNIFWINGFVGKPYIDGAHWYLTTLLGVIIFVGAFKKIGLEQKIYTYVLWMISAVVINVLCRVFRWDILAFFYNIVGGDFVGIVCIGIFLHMFLTKKNTIKINKENILLFVGILIATGHAIIMCGFWRAVGAIIGGVLLVFCIKTKAKIFRNRIFLFFGMISYPLYLCHQNIAYAIEYNLMTITGHHSILHVIVAFVSVVLVAVLLWLFDKYIIQRFLSGVIKL